MIGEQNTMVYAPIGCSCGEVYAVMRIRYGQQMASEDFFFCLKYYRFKYFVRNIFKKFFNVDLGTIKCPNCGVSLTPKDLYFKMAIATAKHDYHKEINDRASAMTDFVTETILGDVTPS